MAYPMRTRAALVAFALAALHCTQQGSGFRVAGSVTGLTGAGLRLHSSLGDDLAIERDGRFAFPTIVRSGTAFKVTVTAQPAGPRQTCAVEGGTGEIANGDSDVRVSCVTDAYRVGGVASGLSGSGLVLQDRGGDDLLVTGNGPFFFAQKVDNGSPFAVTIKTQPRSPTQTCLVTGGTGTVDRADITSVAVSCATDAFSVGVAVQGLAGQGLVLQNAGGDDLSVTANGTAAFATPVRSGAPYAVTVKNQPANPSQTCTVANGTGVVGNGPVTGPVVTCVTDTFRIGGTVSGLRGTGLVLHGATGEDLPVAANGSFQFATPVASGAAYAVTVTAQPSSPTQTCTVVGGTGVVGAADVTTVGVNCSTDAFTVGGSVQGLVGTGLTLQNGADHLAVSANGSFAFPTPVLSGDPFAVTVSREPTSPWQTCVVSSGSGVVAGGPVTGVSVACTTNHYPVGGTVTGLAGTGLQLRNGADAVSVAANGPFTLAPVASGSTYAVTATAQPTSPWQTCTVTRGSGTVAGAAISDVAVACTTNTYRVGGAVSGLLGTGLVLGQGTESLPVAASGAFTFATPVPSGQPFAVSVLQQPTTPAQSCAVAGGQGTIGGSDVTSVAVNCSTNTYSVGGTVGGLAGKGLLLRNNGADDLAVGANGGYAFATPVASGATYDVSVAGQPIDPWQTCAVSGGTGRVTTGPVTTANVACVTDQHLIQVAVTGLQGQGLLLRQSGADDLAVAASGTHAFATKVPSGGAYAVTVATQPTAPWQTCALTSPAGVVSNADVTVPAACTTNTYAVGGTVAGLIEPGLTLRESGGDPLVVNANGPYQFPAHVASGTAYAVTVDTSPTTQACAVSGGSGTVAGADVSTADVTCACLPDLADCDGNPLNGCETRIDTVTDCGGCNVACTTGQTCVAGVCTP